MSLPATALILAGGLGSRLVSVEPDTPKSLVSIAGQPFLHWLVAWLKHEGFSDFVFSIGHKGEQIERWLNQAPILKGSAWKAHREEKPLGTGGAVRACLSLCRENLAVINGDSLILTPLKPASDKLSSPQITGAIIGKLMADASRYGTLEADKEGFLKSFQDKKPGRGIVSAGVTFLRRTVLEDFPKDEILSMENDVMPALIRKGAKIKLHEVGEQTPFIDIGTPESLREASGFIESQLKPRLN